MWAVEMCEVTKQFHDKRQSFTALQATNLRIAQGKFLAVTGASGGGKSTLLNLIGCLARPTSGILKLMGCDLASASEARLAELRNRHLGFVFQSFNLIAKARAWENVAMPLLYRGIATAERRRRAVLLLDELGIGDRAEHYMHQLSGGQRQRVAIARALVGSPDLLLADEPTGSLDPDCALEVMALLHRLHQGGQAIVLVTHDPRLAAQAQRRVCISAGRLQELTQDCGTPEVRIGTRPPLSADASALYRNPQAFQAAA